MKMKMLCNAIYIFCLLYHYNSVKILGCKNFTVKSSDILKYYYNLKWSYSFCGKAEFQQPPSVMIFLKLD